MDLSIETKAHEKRIGEREKKSLKRYLLEKVQTWINALLMRTADPTNSVVSLVENIEITVRRTGDSGRVFKISTLQGTAIT